MAESPGGAGVAGGSGSHESGGGGDQSPASNVREQDRFLPIANIGRIMKKALPANGKIAKDAKDTVQECVSEFISFVTSEASDKCQKEKRKTINGDDLLWAMATLGFEDYVAPLKAYLARYRELEGDTKGSARGADGSAKKDTIGTQLVSDVEIFDSLLIKVPSHKALATQTPKLNIDQINGMWLAFCEAKCKGSKSIILNSCHTYRSVDMFAVPEILYTLLHRRSIIV